MFRTKSHAAKKSYALADCEADCVSIHKLPNCEYLNFVFSTTDRIEPIEFLIGLIDNLGLNYIKKRNYYDANNPEQKNL